LWTEDKKIVSFGSDYFNSYVGFDLWEASSWNTELWLAQSISVYTLVLEGTSW